MNENTPHLEPGTYQHYKGDFYEVIGVGKDTETEKNVVIYRPLYKSDVLYWVRPYAMFMSVVVVGGQTVQRFKKVEDHV